LRIPGFEGKVRPVMRLCLRCLALSGALAVLALARPASAQEDEPGEPPARALPAKKPDLPSPAARWNLVLTGVGVSAGFYAGALGASLIWHNGPWAPDMRIPIVGPWMAMPDLKCGGEPNCGTALVVVRGILAGVDAVGQAGGLALALEGLFMPVRSAQRARVSPSRTHAWVRPVPFVAGRDGVGLGLVGQL
jgi:hypothetical protein